MCIAYLGNTWYQGALWDVLLGSLGFCQPCRCYFDINLSSVGDHVQHDVDHDGSGFFQQVNASCHKAQAVQE